jgi:pyruvate/2-oxoglutarate dehydrogenase complex dihydrolipoamide dehydrogenase (E3) component
MLVQTARLEGRIAANNAILGPTRQASYDVVPSGSFTDPEYGRVGLTEVQAAQHHDVIVGVAHYDDLLRPVADGRPDGFCKLIADRQSHTILGAHVLGEYSAETVQTVAACMAAHMTSSKWPNSSSPFRPSPRRSAWPLRRSAGPWGSGASPRSGAISDLTNEGGYLSADLVADGPDRRA